MENKQLSLKEHQKLLLNMLIEFDSFCKRNDLTYFLHAGTLIGAIRHNGFIPWDNDIDLLMPRDDYNKLISIVGDSEFNGLSLLLPKDSIYTYIKVCDKKTTLIEFADTNPIYTHLYIDVHPLTNTNKDLMDKFVYFVSLLLVYINWFNKFTIPKIKRSFSLVGSILNYLIPNKNWATKTQYYLLNKYHKMKKSKSKYVSLMDTTDRNTWNKSIFEKTVLVDFEGYKFPAPVGFHDLLTDRYGDYMKLPDEKDRYTHDSKVYLN